MGQRTTRHSIIILALAIIADVLLVGFFGLLARMGIISFDLFPVIAFSITIIILFIVLGLTAKRGKNNKPV